MPHDQAACRRGITLSLSSRLIAVVASAALAVSVAITVAPSASAADAALSITCTGGTKPASQMITPGLIVGDTLTVTYTGCGFMGVNFDGTIGSPEFLLTPTSGVTGASLINGYVYTLDASGTVVLTVARSISEGALIVDFGTTSGLTNGPLVLQGAVPVSDPLQSPADILQQTSVPASGSCGDVRDAGFRYGTSVNGGWSLSWANWINPGAGAAVCTRTLTYSNSHGTWVVAA